MNNGRIRLHQDGTKSHILEDDMEFKEVVDEIGLNLTMYTQSPNSPDNNILDLVFFRAIQSFNDDCPANEDAHVPMTTPTPTVKMDGEGGENATTDATTNTGV